MSRYFTDSPFERMMMSRPWEWRETRRPGPAPRAGKRPPGPPPRRPAQAVRRKEAARYE